MHLSIDVGGTFIKYAWFNQDEEITDKGKVKTPLESNDAFTKAVESIVNEVPSLTGISFSLPGTINPVTGYVHQGGTLKYHNRFDFKNYYESYFGVPITVENDARCAAIAELTNGNMLGVDNGVVITFGTGVGSCIIINGEIYRGTNLFSGEISGLVTDDIRKEGLSVILGRKLGIGVFSRYVSSLKKLPEQDGPTVFKWIEDKDPIATEAFVEYCETLSMQLFNMQLILDPKRICVGGGISENKVFMEGIQRSMENYYSNFPIKLPRFELMACKYHNDANLWGAYYHFKKIYNKED